MVPTNGRYHIIVLEIRHSLVPRVLGPSFIGKQKIVPSKKWHRKKNRAKDIVSYQAGPIE